MQQTNNSKKRLFYIDALRALAMLAVVIGHIPLYLLYAGDYKAANAGSCYSYFMNTFHLSLFVFLSGFVSPEGPFRLQKKLKILIPFFLFGVAYAYLTGSDLIDFLWNEAKSGYWFLLVIVYFFALLWIIKHMRINLFLGMLGGEILFWGIYHIAPDFSQNALSITKTLSLWPFFMFGVVCKKYDLTEKLAHYPYLSLVALVAYIAFYRLKLPFNGWIMPLSMIIFLVVGLRTIERYIGKYHLATNLGGGVALISIIGRNTIQIYTIHYFFLYGLQSLNISKTISGNYMSQIEFFASPLLALLIAMGCVGIAHILYKLKLGFVFGR